MKTIALTGGKGGCGKTNIAVNLGIALAKSGQRVTVFDADLGLANLDIVLGVQAEHTLQDVLSGETALVDIVATGPGGIRFIAGGSGLRTFLTVGPKKLRVFLSQIPELAETTDVLIFDTGAGVDPKVTSFLRASDLTVLLVTPDPACVVDSYATAKTLLRFEPSARIIAIMNMVKNEAEALAVFNKLNGITESFLDAELGYGGFVRFDNGAQQFIRKRVPFILGDPRLPASQDVRLAAATILVELEKLKQLDLLEQLAEGFDLDQAA